MYRNKSCILIQFEFNAAFNKRLQKVQGAVWSKTLKGWTIPDTYENRIKCKLPVAGKQAAISNGQKTPDAALQTVKQKQQTTSKSSLLYISQNNKQELKKYLQQLQLKAYSASTIRTYRNEFIQLLQKLATYEVQQMQPESIKRYLLFCIKKRIE